LAGHATCVHDPEYQHHDTFKPLFGQAFAKVKAHMSDVSINKTDI
jgi:hypothetical protein